MGNLGREKIEKEEMKIFLIIVLLIILWVIKEWRAININCTKEVKINKWELFKEHEIRIGCWIVIISIALMAYGSMKDGGNMMGKINEIKKSNESLLAKDKEHSIRLDKLENAPKWHR